MSVREAVATEMAATNAAVAAAATAAAARCFESRRRTRGRRQSRCRGKRATRPRRAHALEKARPSERARRRRGIHGRRGLFLGCGVWSGGPGPRPRGDGVWVIAAPRHGLQRDHRAAFDPRSSHARVHGEYLGLIFAAAYALIVNRIGISVWCFDHYDYISTAVVPYCLRYFILYTAKREGSASASVNHEATARGADEASLQWAKPAGGVADGGGIRDQSCGQWTIPRRLRMAYVPRRLSVGIVQGKSRRKGGWALLRARPAPLAAMTRKRRSRTKRPRSTRAAAVVLAA